MLVLSGNTSGGCCGEAGYDTLSDYDKCLRTAEHFGQDPVKRCGESGAAFVEWARKYQIMAAEIVAKASTETDIQKALVKANNPQAMADALVAQGAPPELVMRLLALEQNKPQSVWSKGLIAVSLIVGGAAAYYGYSRNYESAPHAAMYGAAGVVMPILALSAWRGLKA